MNAIDLTGLSIARAAAAIQAREVSPLELTDAYLQRIERLNPTINAYITVTAERARADARRATDAIMAGTAAGPLHGVPVALKDLYATEGIRTTGGSKIHADWAPDADCTVARRLREAGTVLLGKLNTHEYAYGATTDNPHFGPTRNPWDQVRIPGGSSGGSGAAVAAGLAAGTLGTDTGGSIRIPASLCGITGLKPTYGRVSKQGVMPLSWRFDHPGPMTHTVEDAAIMLQAIAGYDPADAATSRTPVDDYLAGLHSGVRGLRVGVPRGYFYERLDDDVRAAVEAALTVLRELGVEVREVEIPGMSEGVRALFRLVLAEAQEIHAESLRTRAGDFGPDVAAILGQPGPDTATVMADLRTVYRLTEATRAVLEEVDLLVTPTTPVAATAIGQEITSYGGEEEAVIFAMIRCTAPFNATRLPALSVPCGFTRDDLPIGLQIAGRPFDEATVLRAGHAYQQATDWHARHPQGLG